MLTTERVSESKLLPLDCDSYLAMGSFCRSLDPPRIRTYAIRAFADSELRRC